MGGIPAVDRHNPPPFSHTDPKNVLEYFDLNFPMSAELWSPIEPNFSDILNFGKVCIEQ
jgi:hypothetical protein